jgi:hypothetical protein
MSLFGAHGERLGPTASAGPQIGHDDFTVNPNFDKELGLSMVMLRVPPNPDLQSIHHEMLTYATAHGTEKMKEWADRIQKAAVAPMALIPKEAQLLGTQLIISSETAVMTAMCMRILLGLTDPPMEDGEAVRVYQELSKMVRGSHAMRDALMIKERTRQDAMGGPDGSTKPQ